MTWYVFCVSYVDMKWKHSAGKRRADCPEDIAVILNWLSRNTEPVSALTDPAVMRAVLEATCPVAWSSN